MIEIKTLEISGMESAMHGMRNPLNSWSRSDSGVEDVLAFDGPRYAGDYGYLIGEKDMKLARSLASGGPVHAKYRRMITVFADVTAPLYWWKEFDTYRMGVERNSCSTMHTITQKDFTLDDFSHEHLGVWEDVETATGQSLPYMRSVWNSALEAVINALNLARLYYVSEVDPELKKQYWWQIIQLLPSSYNQKRTVMMSYEAIAHMYNDRKAHKLDEWRSFCRWAEGLPYFNGIIDPGASN